MARQNLLIKTTAEFLAGDGIYVPVKRYSVNERINHRAERTGYHILNTYQHPVDGSHLARQNRYIERSLELGIRPHGYSDQEWEQHLSDVRSEEHTERCEAKAYSYQY